MPSYTPEFSAIESLFGWLKNNLKDVVFDTKEKLADLITALCQKITRKDIQGFYRLTFNEMVTFIYNEQLKVEELLMQD